MKNLLKILIFTIPFAAIGQNDLIGNWQIIAIDNGEIYYHFQKDSLSVYPEFGETELTTSKLNQVKSMAKMMYGHTEFSFDKTGTYKWNMMASMEITGNYIVDETRKIIKLEGENSLGEKSFDDFPFILKDDLLEITVPDSLQLGKFVLKRK
ncbi:hypothetical protein [Flavobacterium caeni]|uniref:Lipocalin-like domain-containing protein n=1 Tax=Flavobacterium caeni TaxID=490189 RepID=A0A1G5KCX4_9FLAO|nr:hypothetical protein [Flavobacterium caeni]SCY98274.1 hypothetical protein SAMN02927903_03232 [Flavobacterium caeni]